jgi:murein DD-endopeptidase MepM/ murein hydrolase activator NlpD
MLMPAAQLKQIGRGFGRVGARVFHAGVDLLAPYGSPVRAAEAGEVIFAGRFFGYGNMVDLRHPDGTVTRYAHLSAFAPAIRPGVLVATGALLGKVGTSGHAHGAHLHFEVRIDDHPVDPGPYLALAACPADRREAVEEARTPEPAPRIAVPADGGRPGGLFQ